MADRKRKIKSPCIGACSTTFGDRVCRGCKRFYFEVDRWNRFTSAERYSVWRRLSELRTVVLKDVIVLEEPDRIQRAAKAVGLVQDAEGVLGLAYQLLRHAASTSGCIDGLGFRFVGAKLFDEPSELVRFVENRFLNLSMAHYERYFDLPTYVSLSPGGSNASL